MFLNVSGSEAASLRCDMEIPEDGFDEGELDQNCIYPNWVVSKTFLKLESLGKQSQRMKLCRSDSALVFRSSTMSGLGLSQTESDATTCGSNNSTRESSVEDVTVNRKRFVTFGEAEEIEEAKHVGSSITSMHRDEAASRVLSIETLAANDGATCRDRTCSDLSTPRMVNISSLTTDYSAMYRGRTRTDSRCEDMFRMPSVGTDHGILADEQPQKVDSTFGSTLSATTSYSPRRWRTQTEDDRIEAMMSSKKHTQQHDRGQSEEHTQQTSVTFNPAQTDTSTPSILSHMAASCIGWSQCTSHAPAPPQGRASQVDDVTGCLAQLEVEFQELQEKNRALLEERRRLMTAPSACNGPSAWTTPVPCTPPGCWSHPAEPRRRHVGTSECQAAIRPQERTTIIVQNLPNGFTRNNVVDFLNAQGFAKKFDFIYAPVRFATMTPVGYAFVNLVTPNAAEECRSKLDGFSDRGAACEDALSVVWSENDQGLKAIIERHRNSPVMHHSIHEHFKPAIYKDGVQVTFPSPTKKIKAPKEAKQRNTSSSENHDGRN